MASDDLRARIDAAIRQNMLFGLQDAELDGAGGTQRINEWADWISATVAALVQPELDRERAERDRYRSAWQSARQRARAYGEGIVRLCDDRDSYKEWMVEQGERANRAVQELATVRTALETLTAQSAAALAKRDRARQRARIAEVELETLRAGVWEIGGDPTQVQNLYAQLSSRTRQWKAAEAIVERVRGLAEQWQREDGPVAAQAVMQAAAARLYRALTEPTTKESPS